MSTTDKNQPPAEEPGNEGELEFIFDLPVEVSVELGRRRMSIGEVLKLGRGAIVEFTKQATEPLDIRVNDKLIARGEAVVVGDRYGVRVTDIVSPKERIGSVSGGDA